MISVKKTTTQNCTVTFTDQILLMLVDEYQSPRLLAVNTVVGAIDTTALICGLCPRCTYVQIDVQTL